MAERKRYEDAPLPTLQRVQRDITDASQTLAEYEK
jgi:hypothetical protein